MVDGVAPWWSVCRGGGVLADGGASGGLIDDGLAGGAGGQQCGDREPVDGPGQAAGLAVDGADGIIGEKGVGPAGVLEVPADVPAGFGRGKRGRGDVAAELDALVEGGHVADAQPAQLDEYQHLVQSDDETTYLPARTPRPLPQGAPEAIGGTAPPASAPQAPDPAGSPAHQESS